MFLQASVSPQVKMDTLGRRGLEGQRYVVYKTETAKISIGCKPMHCPVGFFVKCISTNHSVNNETNVVV